MKGNFTWGLIGMQDDEDSEEEEERIKLESINSAQPSQNQTENKTPLSQKINLKNIDLTIKEGEFVCIIGEIGSGKSSLLNAMTGEMVYVSQKTIEEVGGMDAEFTGS